MNIVTLLFSVLSSEVVNTLISPSLANNGGVQVKILSILLLSIDPLHLLCLKPWSNGA